MEVIRGEEGDCAQAGDGWRDGAIAAGQHQRQQCGSDAPAAGRGPRFKELLGASMIPALFTASTVAEGPGGSGERHDRLCRADARPSDPRLHRRSARLALALLRQSGAGPHHPGPRPLLVEIDEPDSSIALMAIALGTLEYVLEEGARWNWFDDATIRDCAAISSVSVSSPNQARNSWDH